MFFSKPKDKLINHPNFWYFLGYFDMKAMAYTDPVFIVPSEEVHTHAAPHLDGDPVGPLSYPDHQVGERVLDIFGNEQVRRGASPLPAGLAALDGVVVVDQASVP